ncbi:MAG TPA: Wzz/FepE/Etk N-terminal domain-containing protein, partial [Clostridia bacterium]|nr:Wzz/FepE/Etk N-terminal domain-containing protein [Clostridia bacterium]
MKKLLFAYVRSSWLIGMVACIAFIGVAFYVQTTPNLYTASATMYVFISNPNQVNYQYTSQSDLNTAARLMQTYMVVIRSNKVMDAVAERLGPQYGSKYIASTLSIGSVAQTEVMRVSSTTPDPQLSMEICNAVAEFAPPEIIRVVNAGSVEVIDYASLPKFADEKGMMKKS